jgi:hypothetical protein
MLKQAVQAAELLAQRGQRQVRASTLQPGRRGLRPRMVAHLWIACSNDAPGDLGQ